LSPVLLGRRNECAILDGLLDEVRAGRSTALVVRGEPGVGKSALLDYVVEQASGFWVARASGVESEMELAFAGLHQLCGPMLDGLERLPGPQRDALRVAFGLQGGEPPDRFLVGLAVLGLFSEVAAERPLVCVVDDAQWLDRATAQALGFVARRLVAESVGLVFAASESGGELEGLPQMVVEGLGRRDARALLASVIAGPLDEQVRDRIVAETRGNPLALLELPHGRTPAELAGGFGFPDSLALAVRIEESFRRRLAALPPDTRRLLLVAAAEPLGEPVLLWRAAERLGISVGAAAPAALAGLLEFGATVRFRHPLVRSAIYQAAPVEERRSVHAALAEVTDPAVDPDRRAWHRAHAAPGPDEEVAAELERSAGRAQARGGLAAAAAFLERAAGLTLDPEHRAERALAAAQAKHQAGAPDAALELLAMARAGPLDELQRARTELLRAEIVASSRGGSDAPPLLLRVAKRLEPLDAVLARETYLELMTAALLAGPMARSGGLVEAAQAARAAPRAPGVARPPDLLLDGLALLITEGYAAGAPLLKLALAKLRDEDIPREDELRWLLLACLVAMDLWDDETWYVLANRLIDVARDAGALAVLATGLSSRAVILEYAGELSAAATLIEEMDAVSLAAGSHLAPYATLGLLAMQGRESEAIELIEGTTVEMVQRGEGMVLGLIHWTRAYMHIGVGRYEEALAAADRVPEYPVPMLYTRAALIELIEAAARSGKPEHAAAALERLTETTRASGTEWALGMEARSRALLSEGAAAEDLYRQAIERLEHTRVRMELARAHLLYGEWLRRERRRLDARAELHTAHDMFTGMGMAAYAQRAARELVATGETARRRTVETSDQLTAREAQIARLARDGLSNPEIAARLFLSPRTVEYHMHKIFTKLDISSRHQLQRVLSRDTTPQAV
jgi:DNA-binding CsgD family transcriptional regulator